MIDIPSGTGTTIVLLALLILTSSAIISSAIEVSDEVVITAEDADEEWPEVAVDSDGDFHLAFSSYDAYDDAWVLSYTKVSTEGMILVGPVDLSLESNLVIQSYEVSVDDTNNVHIVVSMTSDDAYNDIYYVKLDVDGNTKVPFQRVFSSDVHSYVPAIDTDRRGNAYIVWNEREEPQELLWMKLSPQASILEGPLTVSGDVREGTHVSLPQVRVDDEGNSYVFWQQTPRLSTASIYFASISPTGSIEVPSKEIMGSPVMHYFGTSAAIDENGDLHIAFLNSDRLRKNAIMYAEVDRDGDVVREVRLDDPGLNAMTVWPDIAIDPEGNLGIAYQREAEATGSWDVYYTRSENGGNSWDDPLKVTNNGASSDVSIASGPALSGIAYCLADQDIRMVFVGDINNPPIPNIVVNPSQVTVGDTVTCDGGLSIDRDEGDSVEEYFFDFGDGSESGWTSESVVTHVYTSPGQYTVWLTVKDNHGLISTMRVGGTVTVTSFPINEPPVARLSVFPGTADIGELLEYNGGASTDDGSVVSYRFNYGDGTSSDWVTDAIQYHSFDTEGVFTASLTVRDDEGTVSEPDTVTITIVHVNKDPVATIDSISPSPVMEGEDVTFTGHGEDSDGSVIVFNWISDLEGLFGSTATTTTDKLQVGTHVITLRVKDDEGAWSKDVTETLVVMKNQDFVLLDGTRIPGRVYADTKIGFKVTYTDPEDDPPTVTNLLFAKDDDWRVEALLEVDPSDHEYKDGKEYYIDRSFGQGKWKFSFEFENARNGRRTTEVVEFTVQERTGGFAPSLASWSVVLALLVSSIVAAAHRRR